MEGRRVIRVFRVLGLACLLALSLSLAGCGSGTSEPIVGKWRLTGISTSATDGVASFSNGSATVSADGQFSADVASEMTLSGSWQAVLKSDWLATDVESTVGEYKVSLKMGTGGYTDFYAFVSKSENKYQMYLLMRSDTSVSLVFERSS